MFVYKYGEQHVGARLTELITANSVLGRFKKGDTLYSNAELGINTYFIFDGLLRLIVPFEDGNEKTIAYLGNGSLAGDTALFLKEKRYGSHIRCDVISKYAKIGIITKENYFKMLASDQEFMELSLLQSAKKVEYLIEQISALSFKEAKNIVHTVSNTTFREFDSIPTPFLTHQELANLSGCARVTVARAMSAKRNSIVNCLSK